MNEQAVRALIRDAIARHMGQPLPAQADRTLHGGLNPRPPYVPNLTQPHPTDSAVYSSGGSTYLSQPHSSHVLYAGLVNVSDVCVIEPAVPCDHCGYCKSHGH